MESLYFLIPLFFIVFIIIPFVFCIKININAKEGLFEFKLFLLKHKILQFNFNLLKKQIIIIKKKKVKVIDITKNQIDFFKSFGANIFDKIVFKKINIYGEIGLFDVMQTTNVTGIILSFCLMAEKLFVEKQQLCKTNVQVMPNYFETNLIFNFDCKFLISIFDIAYSILISMFIYRKGEEYGKI